MKTSYLIVLLFPFILTAQAEENTPEKQLQMICTAKAHMAKAVQDVRIETGDDWVEFHRKTKQSYKIDAGLEALLYIADFVYHYVPVEMDSSEVYDRTINGCVMDFLNKKDDNVIKLLS